MPVKNLSYDKLEPLIKDNLSTDEDLPTTELIKTLRPAKQRGWLTKDELILIPVLNFRGSIIFLIKRNGGAK